MDKLRVLTSTLRLAEQTKNKTLEAEVHNSLGVHYCHIGRYHKAIDHLKVCLTIANEIRDQEGRGVVYGNFATCHSFLGQYNEAINYLEMSLTIAKESEDKKGEGTLYGNLGACYRSLGQYNKAMELHVMHLTIAKRIGDERGKGAAYGNLGSCFISLGLHGKAIKVLETHLTIAKEIGDKKGVGAAYGNLGTCCIALGNYDKAIKYLEVRLTIAKEIGDKKGEGAAYGNLGTCYIYFGHYFKAVKNFEMHLTIATEIGDKKGEGRAYGNLGTCYNLLGRHHKAEINLKRGVQCYDKLFENVPKIDEYKVSVIDTFIDTYKALIQILLNQEKTGEALVTAEKGRSRALAVHMASTDLFRRPFSFEPNVSNIKEIRKVVKNLGSTVVFFALLITPDTYTWVIQPNGDISFQQRRTEMSKQCKDYYRKDLLPSEELISKVLNLMTSCRIVRCEDRSLSFLYPEEVPQRPSFKKKPHAAKACAAKSANQTVVSQPGIQHPVNMHESKAARTASTAGEEETKVFITQAAPEESLLNCLLKELYHILLKPVRQYVVGSQVTVVPDGALALVPFAALMDENGHYVSDSLQVRLIPSLTIAKMVRERPQEIAAQGRPLVVGDPDVGEVVMDGKVIFVKNLPCAKTEVEMVGQLLHVKPLMGNRATKKKFLQKVESANLIHIAAHGHAKRGEILLASSARTNRPKLEDIMLTLSDLERKRIRAKLVVLSCCHSGRGDVRAEGVVGIARAFLGAGARAVLVTLWAVDDGATLLFMWYFYESLKRGESANEALNEAMKATRKHEMFRHPRYWAPFVLIGENVTPFVKQ